MRATGAARERRADGKVIIERLGISLPYVETFNSKIIKGFVPELRSRYVFFVFRDSSVLCIYVTNILCTFHVAISWLCNTGMHHNGDDKYGLVVQLFLMISITQSNDLSQCTDCFI